MEHLPKKIHQNGISYTLVPAVVLQNHVQNIRFLFVHVHLSFRFREHRYYNTGPAACQAASRSRK